MNSKSKPTLDVSKSKSTGYIKNFNGKRKTSSTGNDEKDAKIEQKEMKKQRQLQRPNGPEVVKAKELWNKLKVKKVDKSTRTGYVNALMDLMEGKLFSLAAKHDASRIIQSVLQYGSPLQRSVVIQELQPHVLELARTTYGHFLVQKMIRYGSHDDRASLAKAFRGHMVKLATHNIAAEVIEYAAEWFRPALMSNLKLEFYGQEFVFFELSEKSGLSDILEGLSPVKREGVMTYLASILNKMVDKQLLGLAFSQKLMWEYLAHASYDESSAMIPNIRDGALALLSTTPGARAVSHCIAYGQAKDRKRVIRALKGKVLDACNHPSGFLVISRLLDVVDDTVTIQKSILVELVPKLAQVMLHPHGMKVMLQLLSPRNKRFFTPDELECFAVPMIPAPAEAGAEENLTKTNTEKVMVPNYKKSPETRREELLRGLKEPLEGCCRENLVTLMTASSASGALLTYVVKEWSSTNIDLQRSICQHMSLEKWYEHPVAHVTIQKMIKELDVNFAHMMLSECSEEMSTTWIMSNRGAFVLKALATKCPDEIKTMVQTHHKALQVQAKSSKGIQVLLEHVTE